MNIPALGAAALLVAAVLPLASPAEAAAGPANVDDVYRYLEDPGMTGEGQQPAHAMLRPYADARGARDDASTRWVRSLNGDWRLKLVDRPEQVPTAFWDTAYDTSSWPVAKVPHTWQSDFLDHPMFRNIPGEIWPEDPPKVPRDNPTGAYVRTFDLPRDWDGRRTFLRFDGVTSGYFVWVNGTYVGYDQGGYTPAEFDLTRIAKPGKNRVALQVHRWGSGSYLEDVDQWRYSGIFRDVTLYSTPQARLADAYVTTDLDAAYQDATLTARVDLARDDAAPGRYEVRGTLYDRRGREVTTMRAPAELAGGTASATLRTQVANPQKWSAEEPNLYRLVLELAHPNGSVVHTTAQNVGFREVTVADKQLLVNGKRILVKGTNRAETDPDTGRHVTHAAQERDVMLLKRLHLNAVRTSHYPSDPHFYDLADRHGLWVADEIDIETHSFESCPDNCLASRPEWQQAFAERFQAMVERDKNHPSVIIWDTGNEAGLGTAHFAMAEWADANEPTRLLYHQSNWPNGDAPFADVGGPRYPTPAALEAVAKTTTKPLVMGEYDHAQGNSLGNLGEFWDLARKYPQVQGGFIWDWAEANLRQPLFTTPDSSRSRIQAFAVGKPSLVDGRRGKAISLSGWDDFVDVFRDPRLEVTGPFTLDAWVKPGRWSGSFAIVTKGEQYGLRMRDASTLEFGVDLGSRQTVTAPVPADWVGSWHRVTGVYDGAALRLYVDGAVVAEGAAEGMPEPGLWEVNVGRDAQEHQDNFGPWLARGLVDDVRIHPVALSAAQLAAGADPYQNALLALDFDRFDRRGDFPSLGVSLSGTDGLVGTDRYLQPETVELASVHTPVRFSAVDAAAGQVRVRNEQQAGTLALRLYWSLVEVDRTLRSGSRPLVLGPGETVDLDLGHGPANPHDRERWLNVSAVTTADLPWAKKGWTFAADQFPAGGRVVPGVVFAPTAEAARLVESPRELVVSGKGWRYRFDTAAGTLTSMTSGGRELLHAGPELSVYRSPTSNETYGWGTADRQVWREIGLDQLRTKVSAVSGEARPDGTVEVEVRSTAAAPGKADRLSFTQTMRYRIDARGTITLAHRVQASGSRLGELPYLPRVGVSVRVPDELDAFAYYGRGPAENYNDRSRGSLVGRYHSTVDDEYVRYSRPQAYGNHTDTRWATLSDGRRAGVLVGAVEGDLDVSVTPYDRLELAEYDFQLPLVRNRGWTTLHVATIETGMGETPNSVQSPYLAAPGKAYEDEVVLRPLTRAELHAGGVPDSRAVAPCPPDVALVTDGEVEAGVPEQVRVRVSARCAAGVSGVTARLNVPAGWTSTPASVSLGSVGFGSPKEATFTVVPAADTDFGRYEVSADVAYTSPPGFTGDVRASASVTAPLPAGSVWLSDRPYTPVENGWGPVEKDQSNGEQPAGDGRPLTIDGVTYAKGLGAHAFSRVVVPLDGACTSFRSEVGVDDETGSGGSVTFEVWVDGTRRAASGVLTGGGGAERLAVDVTGARQLELHVTDAGNGNGLDHADWAAARLACA